MEKEIRVSRTTSTKGLASSISLHIEKMSKDDEIKLKAIGASAVSQATKAIAIATVHAKSKFAVEIAFENVMINSKECSALVWKLKLN